MQAPKTFVPMRFRTTSLQPDLRSSAAISIAGGKITPGAPAWNEDGASTRFAAVQIVRSYMHATWLQCVTPKSRRGRTMMSFAPVGACRIQRRIE
jgi:hypothetical protein